MTNADKQRRPPNWISLLRCPMCSSNIEFQNSVYRCKQSECRFSEEQGILSVDQQPILIDESASVVDPVKALKSRGESLVARRTTGWMDRVLRVLNLTSARLSRGNSDLFLRLCRSSNACPTILIVGGGARGSGTDRLYREAGSGHALLGFDVYASSDTDFVADAHDIPLKDGSVDGVWIQAVLEHVVDPHRVIAEVYRVLVPGGVIYSEIPFMQQVHEGAYDFTRFTLSGHRYLLRRFTCVSAGVVGGVGTQLVWSIEYFIRAMTRSRLAGKMAKLIFIWLVWFDSLADSKYSVDAASGTFMLGRKTDGDTLTHKDVVGFYSGGG